VVVNEARSGALHRCYAAVPASIPEARSELTRFAAESGVDAEQLFRIRLSASEALTNVVKHAYDDEEGQIELLAAIAGGELCVLIADDGGGLRPCSDTTGLGLGLPWMALFSDQLTVATRSSRGVEVQMRFALDGALAPDGPHERGSLASASLPA
jgi:serine/threonine-protein kinase RsbW